VTFTITITPTLRITVTTVATLFMITIAARTAITSTTMIASAALYAHHTSLHATVHHLRRCLVVVVVVCGAGVASGVP
jgi:hypothetical protein